jgi:hypothetical protein
MSGKLETYLKHRKETLSVFGIHRYNDWAVLFFITVIMIILVTIYAFFIYRDTMALLQGKDTVISPPSTSDGTKADFESISSLIQSKNDTSTESLPRDPSLR